MSTLSDGNIALIGVLISTQQIVRFSLKILFLHLVSKPIIMIMITYNDNDALIENISVTESNSQLAKNLLEDTLENKSDNDDNDENTSFPFLKKIKSEHLKNLFFEQLNMNSIRNKFE